MMIRSTRWAGPENVEYLMRGIIKCYCIGQILLTQKTAQTYPFNWETVIISGFMSTFFANSIDNSIELKLEGSKRNPFFNFLPPWPDALPAASSNSFLEASKSNIFPTVCHKNSTFLLYTAAVPCRSSAASAKLTYKKQNWPNNKSNLRIDIMFIISNCRLLD